MELSACYYYWDGTRAGCRRAPLSWLEMRQNSEPSAPMCRRRRRRLNICVNRAGEVSSGVSFRRRRGEKRPVYRLLIDFFVFAPPSPSNPTLIPQDGFKGRCLLWVLDIEQTSMIRKSYVGVGGVGGVVLMFPQRLMAVSPPGRSQLTWDHYPGLLPEPLSSQFDRQAGDQRFLQTIRQIKAPLRKKKKKKRWWRGGGVEGWWWWRDASGGHAHPPSIIA